jgi:hypothetical protein
VLSQTCFGQCCAQRLRIGIFYMNKHIVGPFFPHTMIAMLLSIVAGAKSRLQVLAQVLAGGESPRRARGTTRFNPLRRVRVGGCRLLHHSVAFLFMLGLLLSGTPFGFLLSQMPAAMAQPAASPSISATQSASFDDADGDGKAEPGQTINYSVTITNNGTADARDVVFSENLDASASLVTGSVQSTPLGLDDAFSTLRNQALTRGAINGLLANDRDPDSGNNTGLTASGPDASDEGGTVSVNSNGSFSYTPAAGFQGTDFFDYTVSDSTGRTATARATITVAIGEPVALAITTQPSATAPSGAAFARQPVVELRDAANNTVPRANVDITAAIASGDGTLGGTATVATNASGAAAFTNLKISGTIGDRTLQLSSTGLSGATSGTITITAGAADRLSITTEPSSSAPSGAAFARQPVIQLRDASGNAVAQAGVSVSAAIASGAGTLSGTTSVATNADGVATFGNLSISGTVGDRTLAFTSTGLTDAASDTITISAGAPERLSITTQPSSSARSGVAFEQQPLIQLRDASGNAVSQADVNVTAAIASGGGTLGGAKTVATDANGVADFSNLLISGTVGDRTLSFSATGLTGATSGTINLTAGAASQLSISTQPSATARNGEAFARQPVVQLQDASGNDVSQTGITITVALASGDGTLGGAATATTNASGTATFTGLRITGTVGERTLRFSAAGLTGATSDAISVTPGAPTQLSITTQPSSSAQAGVEFARQPVIQLRDASGNAVSQANVTIAVAIASGDGTLGGTATATTDASGTATFTNLSIGGTVGDRTLGFFTTGLMGATSNTISITPGAATALTFSTQPTNVVASAPITPAVKVSIVDVYSNVVTSSTDNITLAIGNNPSAGALSGTTTVAAVNGVATFSNLSINLVGTGYTLAASATGLAGAASTSFNVTHGPLHHFLVEKAGGGPIGTQDKGTAFNVRVTAQDEYNNTVTNYTGTVGFTSTPAGGIGAGNTSGAFTAGVLSSHSIRFDTAGSFTLTATNIAGAQSGTSNSFEVQSPPDAIADAPDSNSAPGQPLHALFSTAASPQTFTLLAPGVLSNDSLGSPVAAITFFGGGSLGGAVGDHAAGATVTVGTGGSIQVNPNGSVSFRPANGFTGLFTFNYRLANVRGEDEAQVTIAVGERPSAANDTYSPQLVGNVPIDTTTSTQFNITTNDGGDAKVLAVTAQNNGTAAINSDGTFRFRPNAGYSGAADFSYTVANGFGTSAPATVSLNVGAPVWFVNAAAPTNGDGRFDSPFKDLGGTGFASSTLDEANENIFLHSGNYSGGVTLLNGQKLIGQGSSGTFAQVLGATFPADSGTPPSLGGAGASPVISTTATTPVASTHGINISGGNNTIRGLSIGTTTGSAIASGASFGTLTVSEASIGPSTRTGQALALTVGTVDASFSNVSASGAATGISLSNVNGILTIGGGSMSNLSGSDFNISGGMANVAYAGTISNTAGQSINVSSKTGGTVAFSGAITDSGSGISLSNNNGATVNFTGGLSLSTGTNAAFSATGGGTVSATQNNTSIVNTIATTTGTALNVSNTSIGASGLNFRSISANGATNGIVLSSTGTSGLFSVTGTGTTENSGGIIQNVGGDAVVLSTTTNVSLKNMTIGDTSATDTQNPDATNNIGDDGIQMTGVTPGSGAVGLTLDNVKIARTNNYAINGSGGGNVGFKLLNSRIFNAGDDSNDAALYFGTGFPTNDQLTGTVQIVNTTIAAMMQDGFKVENSGPGTLNMTVSASTFKNNDEITFGGCNTCEGSAINVITDGSSSPHTPTANILIENTLFSEIDTVGILAHPDPGGVMNITANNCTFNNPRGAAAIEWFSGSADPDDTETFRGAINNIDVQSIEFNRTAIYLKAGAGNYDVTMTGGTVNSGHAVSGSSSATGARGIEVNMDSDDAEVVHRKVKIDGVTVKNFGSDGIQAITNEIKDGSTSDIIIQNCTIGTTSEPVGRMQQSAAEGIEIVTTNNLTSKVLIQNNSIYTEGGFNSLSAEGIDIQAGWTSTINATVLNNTIGTPGGGTSENVYIATVTFLNASSTNPTLNLDFRNNISNSGPDADYRLDGSVGTFRYEGSGTGAVTASQIQLANQSGTASVIGSVLNNNSTDVPMPSNPTAPTLPPALLQFSPDFPSVPALTPHAANSAQLTQSTLDALVKQAIARWEATGLTAAQRASMRAVKFEVADLPGVYLGEATHNRIRIDSNAGGNGWFIDATPDNDSEFGQSKSATRFYTDSQGAPAGRIDLLSTILHELGHTIGLSDSYLEQDRDDVMFGHLTLGERRLPRLHQARGAVPHHDAHPHFLSAPLTVNIGNLPPGKSVTITFQATVNNPVSAGVTSISNQGTISGSNFADVPTNDPNTTAAADATITLLAANDAPVNTVPAGPLAVDENGTLAISGISVADSDARGGEVTLTLGVSHGTLAVSTSVAGGLVAADITGNNTSSVTLTSTLAKINATLAASNGLTYRPTTNYNGNDSLTVVSNDGGNTGAGGAKTDSSSIAINVAPIADTPSVTDASTSEDTQTTSGLVISRSANDGAEVTHFKITGITNGTLFQNDGTTPIANNAFITFAQGSAGLKFTPARDFNGAASFDVRASVSASDAGLGGSTVTATITVSAINDAPVLSNVESAALAYAEGAGAKPITSTLTVEDVDNTNLGGATVSLNGFVAGEDSLGFSNQNGISGSFNPATGVLTLSGGASVTNYQAALRSVTYRNSSASPSTQARTARFRVDDGQGANSLSAAADRAIAVSPSNDAPVAVADTASTDEDTPVNVQVLANDSDVDSSALRVVRVGTSAATHGTVSINPDDTLRFVPEANFNGASTFSYTISDGSLESTALVTVQVLAVNDAPVARDDTASTAFGTPVSVQVLANDADVEGDNLSVSGVDTAGTRGTVSIADDRKSVRFVPEAGFSGSTSFGYTISDGQSTGSARVTVQVLASTAPDPNPTPNPTPEPSNRAPVAVADRYTTRGPLQVRVGDGVLRNDSDADGNTLRAVLKSGPTHGKLLLNADGSFNYTPSTVYAGPDSFSYVASDGQALSASVAVTITVQAPLDVTPPLVTLAGGARLSLRRLIPARGSAVDVYALPGRGVIPTSGLKSIVLQLQRADGQFWNGRSYQRAPFNLRTRLLDRSFFALVDTMPPPALAPAGLYKWTAVATDNANNVARAVQNVVVDITPPTIAITTPAGDASNLARVTRLDSVSGHVAADAVVVELAVRRSDGRYWNGRSYQVAPISGSVRPSAGGWSFPALALPSGANLPPGRYTILARALDEAGNEGRATRTLVVESGPTR